MCIVLALGLLVGCGGSDSNDDGASREAFIRQANAVCFKANSEAGSKIFESYETPEVKQATEADAINLEVNLYVPILKKDAQSQHDGIAALEAPSDEEEKVETLLESYKAWLKKADDVPLKIVVSNDIYNHARELAGKMGLAKCEQTPFEEPYPQAKGKS
jgi:hypothetical protein